MEWFFSLTVVFVDLVRVVGAVALTAEPETFLISCSIERVTISSLEICGVTFNLTPTSL